MVATLKAHPKGKPSSHPCLHVPGRVGSCRKILETMCRRILAQLETERRLGKGPRNRQMAGVLQRDAIPQSGEENRARYSKMGHLNSRHLFNNRRLLSKS